MLKKFLWAFVCLSAVSGLRAEPYALKAGAARVKITPAVETFTDANRNGRYDAGEPFEDLNKNGKWDPVWLAGYRGDRWAKGVHDDIWVRTLALTQQDQTVLFISLDVIGYLFDEVNQVKKEISAAFRIPKANILIAATHQHSGPDTIGIWGEGGKSGKNPDYMKWVREKTMESAAEALRDQKPARLAFGQVEYDNPIEDCRPPNVKNPLLLSLRAVDGNGRTIAVLVNYAMHAEVLDESNRLITSDYPGVLRDRLEKEFGGTALFFAGDIGGMQSPFVLFHRFWTMRRVGEAVADKVIESLKGREPGDIPMIEVKGKDMLLPVDNPRFRMAIQNGQFGETAQFVAGKEEGGILYLPTEVVAVRLGPAQFAGVPGELFPEVGNDIRKYMSAEHKFLIGLCNNEIGYIVPGEEWRDDGYEESMSLGPKTASMIFDELSKLLQ